MTLMTGPAPEDAAEATLPPTHIRCHTCGTYQPVPDPGRWTECHNALMTGEDHPVTHLHLSDDPLGYSDDRDCWASGIRSYVYLATEPS